MTNEKLIKKLQEYPMNVDVLICEGWNCNDIKYIEYQEPKMFMGEISDEAIFIF